MSWFSLRALASLREKFLKSAPFPRTLLPPHEALTRTTGQIAATNKRVYPLEATFGTLLKVACGESIACQRYRRRYLRQRSANSRRTRTRAPSWFSARARILVPRTTPTQSELFSTQRFKPALVRLE